MSPPTCISSSADVEEIAYELDAIRQDVEDSLRAKDAAYIRRVIQFQRALDVRGASGDRRQPVKKGWLLGTGALAYAKSIENMELGHNISHGQWDWMNDPEIHSNTWEWDMVGHSAQWRYSHNYRHHVYSNVLGMDEDIGYRLLRVTEDQPWRWWYLATPLRNLVLAAMFEWGIALHGLHSERSAARFAGRGGGRDAEVLRQGRPPVGQGLCVHARAEPASVAPDAGGQPRPRIPFRNLWVYVNIICGHIPGGAETFDPAVVKDETRGEWYLRRMLGTANFEVRSAAGALGRAPVLPDRASPVP